MIGAIFSAAKQLDANYVPAEGRKCFLRLEEYYKLANATNAVNIDFLIKQVEKMSKDIEKLKDKQRTFANGNGAH